MGYYDLRPRVPLNEAYFGETPGIQKVQRALTVFRSKFKAVKYGHNIWSYNTSKELRELCHAVEDEFGFEMCSIAIFPSTYENAFTVPLGYKFDVGNTRNKLVVNKRNGFKYDKKAGYAINLNFTSALILDEYYTDREVMAIMLHEIGHNFGSSVNKHIGALTYVAKALFCVSWIYSIIASIVLANPVAAQNNVMLGFSLFNSIEKILSHIDRFLKDKLPMFVNCITFLDNIIGFFTSAIAEFIDLAAIGNIPMIISALPVIMVNAIINNLATLATSPTSLVSLILGYQDEKFSDMFPSMYGYGPDLVSALDKMHTSGHTWVNREFIYKNLSVFGAILDLVSLPVAIVLSPFDPHPNWGMRTKSVLDTLEREYSEIDDPRLKARLKKEIKQINDNALLLDKQQQKMLSNNSYIDPKLYSRIYYAYLIKHGGDVRHHLYKFMKDNMDEVNNLLLQN